MKKEYLKPEMKVIKIDYQPCLMAHSGYNHGHENACAHNGNQWFCDEDE